LSARDGNAIIDGIASEAGMASITIRNLDDKLKHALRRQAAANDRSMEEEARILLRQGLTGPAVTERPGLAAEIRGLVAEYGGFELALPDDPPYLPPALE
jgi:plasmid stability protein